MVLKVCHYLEVVVDNFFDLFKKQRGRQELRKKRLPLLTTNCHISLKDGFVSYKVFHFSISNTILEFGRRLLWLLLTVLLIKHPTGKEKKLVYHLVFSFLSTVFATTMK